MMNWIKDQHNGNFIALLASAVAATLAPLEVFIFVYAFIGPFHYLTEMAWLNKKDFYFSKGPFSSRWYVGVALVLCALGSYDLYAHRGFTGYAVGLLLLISFTALVRNPFVLIAALIAGYAAKFFIHGYVIFIGAILPTIVHVYFFTILFLISGLVREKKRTGLMWANTILLIGMPILLLLANRSYAVPGGYWIDALRGFTPLIGYIEGLMGGTLHAGPSLLSDPTAAAILRFLAFIYLYHYLNWFAKTELLKWHRVSRRTWAAIAVLYTASIGCYLYSFMLGFYVVNFLGLLHVFLELPLNWHTGHFLSTSLRKRWLREHIEQVAA